MKTSSQSNCSGGPLWTSIYFGWLRYNSAIFSEYIIIILYIIYYIFYIIYYTLYIIYYISYILILFTVTYFCRIDDKEEAAEYGIENFPAMVYFDKVDLSRTKYWKKSNLFPTHSLIKNKTLLSLENSKPLLWGAGHRRHTGVDDRANRGRKMNNKEK